MNNQIKKLFKKAGGKVSVRNLASSPVQITESYDLWDENVEKFSQLIVEESINKLKEMHDWQTVNNQNYPGPWHDGIDDCIKQLKEHFDIESPGWVCPKCGTDRTKAVCPKGHNAAITGECPMHGVAQ